MHSKCLCNFAESLDGDPGSSKSPTALRKKTGRFVPVTPSLPNGISDALMSFGSNAVVSHSKQRVDSLLNPCDCKSIWKCRCRTRPDHSRSNTSSAIMTDATLRSGLTTLARAAALCDSNQSFSSTQTLLCDANSKTTPTGSAPSVKRQLSRPYAPPGLSTQQRQHTVPGPSLPPLLFSSPSFPMSSHQVPDFPTIPPMSTITSIAGSGCTCGLLCACPGCVEHRGEEQVSKDCASCATGCTTCVDWRGGIELPFTTQLTATDRDQDSIINQFFARAAALPLPPQSRIRSTGVDIDPTNVMVYPSNLFANHDTITTSSATTQKRTSAFSLENRDVAFGLVKVPKLECCGGRCGCPEDGCSCKKSCGGRCGQHRDARRSVSTSLSEWSSGQTRPQTIAASALPSCCAK